MDISAMILFCFRVQIKHYLLISCIYRHKCTLNFQTFLIFELQLQFSGSYITVSMQIILVLLSD